MTVYRAKSVGVVVPAYDEAGFVGEVIDTIPAFVDRIYPVDDASTDSTWAEIRDRARRQNGRADPSREETAVADRVADARRTPGRDDESVGDEMIGGPRVVPLRHDENRGVGAAIKTGYRRAYDDGVDVVAVMAGDGQMDPDLLDRILDPVVEGRADYAKGNRLHDLDDCASMSEWRLFGNVLLTTLTKVASGYWKMMDPQNGYTAISRDALRDLDLESVFDDYGFANALLIHLNVADARVADVPMPAQYGDEQSGIRYSTFVPQLSALLAKGFGWRLASKHSPRSGHPLPFLYGAGLLATLGGAVGGIRNRLPGGESDGRGLGTALVGVLSAALAVTLDAAENEHLYVESSADESGRRSEDDRPDEPPRTEVDG